LEQHLMYPTYLEAHDVVYYDGDNWFYPYPGGNYGEGYDAGDQETSL
jgi:hypothetical protein